MANKPVLLKVYDINRECWFYINACYVISIADLGNTCRLELPDYTREIKGTAEELVGRISSLC